jgi:holo-[acyl-carrier protein] synthase
MTVVGIGVDVVDVERFAASLQRTPSMRTRLFTAAELAYVDAMESPAASLAARFAAREAVMKALGVGLGAFGFHDVSVHRAESGQPSLSVSGAAQRLASDRGVTGWHLSLSHAAGVAVAYVVAVGES